MLAAGRGATTTGSTYASSSFGGKNQVMNDGGEKFTPSSATQMTSTRQDFTPNGVLNGDSWALTVISTRRPLESCSLMETFLRSPRDGEGGVEHALAARIGVVLAGDEFC